MEKPIPLSESPHLRAELEKAKAAWARRKLEELTAICNGNRAHAERVLAEVIRATER